MSDAGLPRRLVGVIGLTVGAALLVPALTVAALGGDDAARKAAVIQPTNDFSKPEAFELRPGGAATSLRAPGRNAFSFSSSNMSFERELDFKIGNGIFRRIWVSAPSTTRSSDGLGPLYNAHACQRCHLKDGRGHAPVANWPQDNAISMLIRLSIPPQSDEDREALVSGRVGSIPDPVYGGQLQDFAVPGLVAEGRIHIDYTEVPVTLADGHVVTLRAPRYTIADLGFGPLHDDVMLSPRVAPPMIGLGLLEFVTVEDILANADPEDRDGDGISGKANMVWDEVSQGVALGRFGWKAGQPTLRQQNAAAFAGDIGISTTMFQAGYGDCSIHQTACRNAPNGNHAHLDDVEAPDVMLDLTTFYSRNLAVPARRDMAARAVLDGKRVFYEAGCTGCHIPKFVTQRDKSQPEQSFQLIWPYSDMLLHDMGPGLADNRPDGGASGQEWRTPPLWGIGLTETVNGHTQFLHDGRAQSLLEAILWHGGEAETARDAVVGLDTAERDNLLKFLESL